MPNRDNGPNSYRYKYQGQEVDPETGKEAFELRLWDARIGRWLSTDPYGQYNSPYLGMGNDPINGIDLDGGWKTKWARFWGWVGGGFEGKFVGDGTASNPYKNYGVRKGRTLDDGQGSFGGTVELYNYYGDWKSAAISDLKHQLHVDNFEQENGWTPYTTYDSRARAIAGLAEFTLPSAKVKVPNNWKIFTEVAEEASRGGSETQKALSKLWGKNTDVLKAIKNLNPSDIKDLKSAGVSLENIEAWASFYSKQVTKGNNALTKAYPSSNWIAKNRALLMKKIHNLW